MKKWMYVIIPAVMLGLFIAVYIPHIHAAQELDAQRKAKAAQLAAEDAAKKAAIAERSKADAREHAAAALREEEKKAADREAKYQNVMAKIKADTEKYTREADVASKKIADLQIELEALHRTKETETRNAFEIDKRVELANVQKENADMEVARIVQMIATRAQESAMAKMPVAAPTPPSS
jgi:hypothetical protein